MEFAGGEEEDEGEMLDALSNEQLTLSSFDPGRPTKILIHGYNGRGDGANSKRIRNALLKRVINNSSRGIGLINLKFYNYSIRGHEYFHALNYYLS
jgi:hypothetical protein